ncbi:MAG: sulfatase-like hydrolase/transferase [Bacteroidetes bacterium]|nr:sulfatase-like hydrolase/transferase [Bacteroidota bacterium]
MNRCKLFGLIARNLILELALFAAILLIPGCRFGTNQPNIVFIFCDQMSPRAMGWTGQMEVKTPHLDDFSNSSFCFTNAYCTSPVCAPARHSIYTGVYPSRHRVFKNDMRMNEEFPTIMAMMNEKGYTTANIGKMHNAPYHHRRDFQYVLNHEFFMGAAGISHYDAYKRNELEKRGITDYSPYSHIPEGKIWLQVRDGIANINDGIPEDIIPEQWMTNEALKFMDDQEKNRPEKPFFLHLSYFPPHHPYMPVKEYADMYLDKMDELQLPPNYDHERLQRWCKESHMRPDSLTEEDVRYFRALYFGFMTQLDAALGDLFTGIEERGLMENSIIIFTSDHGDNLGEHGEFYKRNMFEGSVRVPLMIHWPGKNLRKRKIIPENVSHVDLVPTMLNAIGIELPEYLAGYDMLPLMKGKENWSKHSVYSEYYSRGTVPSQLMLKKGDFKLIYDDDTPSGAWETYIYNCAEDPWEMNDLMDDPDHIETQIEYIDGLMLDYWDYIKQFRPEETPEIVRRVTYDIDWPADPWKVVAISPVDTSVTMY